MSDDAITAALAKRAEAEEKIRKYEAGIRRQKEQITEINTFIRSWEKFSGRPADIAASSKPLNDIDELELPQPRMVAQNPRKEDVAKVARAVLANAVLPMSRNDLYKELLKRGLTITGKDPEMVLSTMLWRTREISGIERLKTGGYCLKGSANPEEVDESGDGLDEEVGK